MVECNSIEYNSIESIEHNSVDTSNLNNQQFWLNKMSKIEDYFITEIKGIELMSKKLRKYISFLIILISLYVSFVYRTSKKVTKNNKK